MKQHSLMDSTHRWGSASYAKNLSFILMLEQRGSRFSYQRGDYKTELLEESGGVSERKREGERGWKQKVACNRVGIRLIICSCDF